jgi:hypothetical protein
MKEMNLKEKTMGVVEVKMYIVRRMFANIS